METYNEYVLRKAVGAAVAKNDPDAIIEAAKAYTDVVKLDTELRITEQKVRWKTTICVCVAAVFSVLTLAAFAFLM